MAISNDNHITQDIRYVIIDDDAACIRELESLISKLATNFINIGTASKPAEILKLLKETNAEVAFLDINVAGTLIFDILSQLNFIPFKIVFVTAYERYVLQALRLSAVDYLLKPVEKDELQAAIFRLQKKPALQKENSDELEILTHNLNKLNKIKKIGIPTRKGYLVKDLNELLYIKGAINYSELYFTDNVTIKFTIAKTLGDMETMLDTYGFIRIHQSYLINLSYIDFFNSEDFTITLFKKIILPVSTRRKAQLLERLKTIM